MDAKQVLALAQEKGAKMVDFKFIDLPGTWQHFTRPIHQLEVSSFQDGFGFDGSSIRGWQPINASDMLAVPDPTTAKMDPFLKVPTLSLICQVVDPITKESYTRDPRFVAKKAEAFLRQTGIADVAHFGPEAEFFVFDEVRYEQTTNKAFYEVDSGEGSWNSGRAEYPNLGYKTRPKEGYFPAGPSDTLHDLRTEMCLELEKLGLVVENQHHEVASGGQCEIDFKYDRLLSTADNLMWFKYAVKQVARKHQKSATFMPKPLYGDNGSGMHCHVSLWKGEKPLFAGDKYAGLSETALHFIGGVLRHAKALCAFTNPTTNSYRRLVPGFEAPVNLAYSSRNRSAAIRIPMVSSAAKAKRLEFRTPDPSCNPYLAFAAILMAGLDGIQKRINPGDPLDKDIYGLSPEELREIPTVPASLDEALYSLRNDHEFLMKGDVFTPDLIDMWTDYKYDHEVDPMRMRPTPYEFHLYYDA
jgi:glutamine synthetase